MIRDEACEGHIIVACGGGGIPIKRTDKDGYVGVEAVVDKDLTTRACSAPISAPSC